MAQLMVPVKAQFLDSNGDPLSGGKVYSYDAGTTTPRATYTDKDAGTPNANPVILDANGQADIWLDGESYKIRVDDSDDVTLYTIDDVKSINDGAIDTAMLADDAVTTAKIADNAVTIAKLASGIGAQGSSVDKTADYTATSTDDIIYIDAISNDVTISLPPSADNANKILTLKRVDDHEKQIDTFVDGDVTTGTETIAVSSHPFYDYQRVQLTSSGTLPAGLSLATDYYIIKVDANNIKLASSRANAISGTAVDITAAAGGGTHTITSQINVVTVDAYLSETIDGVSDTVLNTENDYIKVHCDGTEWRIVGDGRQPALAVSESKNQTVNITATSATDVDDLEVEITVRGDRPVEIVLISDTRLASPAPNLELSASADNATANVFVDRGGSTVARTLIVTDAGGATSVTHRYPAGSVRLYDTPTKGTHTYKIQASVNSGGSLTFEYLRLMVREL